MFRTFLAACLLAILTATPLFAADNSRPPNIVFIFTDDQGYTDVGCYGAKGFRTPNLDRMAAEGVRFTDFYVAQAVCSASRTALLTGCYPNRLGIFGALGPKSLIGISDKEMTIAQVLKQRGYATAIFGKWHLGFQPQFLPTRHGFDEYFGLPYSNDMIPRPNNKDYPPLPLFDGEKTVATMPDVNQLTTQYTERAVSFIERNKDRPFFLYVPHTMPHVPLGVSEKFRGKSAKGLYGDVMMELDWSVGEILAAIKKHDLDNNTLVFFSCDNGPWLSYGNHGGSATGLREGKGTSFEGGVREPFIARWPGKIPAGRVCHEPAMTIDILPTLATLTGAPLPPLPIDGLDIGALLWGPDGAKSPHEALYFYWDRGLQAVRSGDWKLHLPHSYRSLTKPPGNDGKGAGYTEQKIDFSLFNLKTDPAEQTDVASKNPNVAARLLAMAEKATADLGDSLTKRTGRGERKPGRVAAPQK
jgi:arylsulfatase A